MSVSLDSVAPSVSPRRRRASRRLLSAIHRNNLDLTHKALAQHADLAWADPSTGWTPLELSALRWRPTLASIILSRMSDEQVARLRPQALDLLLELWPDQLNQAGTATATLDALLADTSLSFLTSRHPWGWLGYAVDMNHPGLASLLVEQGVQVNHQGPEGQGLLHLAAELEAEGMVEWCLAQGLTCRQQDEGGNTPTWPRLVRIRRPGATAGRGPRRFPIATWIILLADRLVLGYFHAMRNPRPTCPNDACGYSVAPPAGFYRKRGYYRPKHNHQPVPRYECRGCGKLFSATVVKAVRDHHRPELNQQVFKLAVSGVSMRRMAELLGCSRSTIDRKISHLAQEAQKHHAKRLASIETAYVMVDELETFLHARYKQLAVPVAIRAKTGEVLSFAVGRKPSSMRAGIQGNRWVLDDRPVIVPKVLSALAPVLKPGATIASDSHPQYPNWIGRALPGAKHHKLLAIHEPGYDPLFAINLAFAKMRNDLARLGRKTWTTTKSIKALENHLWLWVAWTNGYRLR